VAVLVRSWPERFARPRSSPAGSVRARRAFAATSRPSITARHRAASRPCSATNASARSS